MFFTDRKLKRRVEETEKYRYRDILPLSDFSVLEDLQNIPNPTVPAGFAEAETMRTGALWSGRDRYLWLHRDVRIPDAWKGKKAVGVFDFGKTGMCNNSGFESMCYLNGKPYQGVDGNHREVFFREEDCGKTVSLTFRLWSGLEGGGIPTEQEHRIKTAFLAWLDEKVDDFYYMGTLVLETMEILGENSSVGCELRNVLEEACRCIDWSQPGNDSFYHSVYEADAILNERIDRMDKHSLVTIRCVGHTHIDTAWLWRLKHTREKASRSFSTVLRLMEQFPEYIFLQTQPQLYAYIRDDFPELFKEIKKRVSEGRWEVDGAMWVEADCNLTSGESLTRQILLGSRFMVEEFGKEPEYLWLPDVFGYSWALPQILKKSGIDVFMTTKISWNQYNRMPHDTFMWRGIDGSEVLTHFITTPEPGSVSDAWYYTYNGFLSAETVQGTWDAYRDKQMNRELLISYGYGDGGGGVNRDLLERRRRIDRMPGLPALKTSTAGAYFRDLKKTVENTDQYVHTWDGELYLELHRGTYTSQAYNKKMNRRMELLYRRAEWLTAMGSVAAEDLELAEQEKLTEGWYQILTNQFHDIIPGSSIHEVYEDCRKSYAEVEQIADLVEQNFVHTAVKEQEDVYTVFNASGWTISEIAEIPEKRQGSFIDETGSELLSQKSGEKTLVYLEGIPSMGMKEIHFTEKTAEKADSVFTVRGRRIETPFYCAVLNEAGQISRLFDKEAEREVIPAGQQGNVLQLFEDKPLNFDAWDIDIFYQEKRKEITSLERFTVKEKGPLRLVVEMAWTFGNSVLEQDMIFYAKCRRIDFVTKADFQERQQLLKVAFPVDIRSVYATYDIQYGNVRRPNHWNTSWDQARFETVGHRFADLSERGYGVSLLNDCKYGYDVKGNVLRLSLLRSAVYPDYLQDVGLHEFTYSLYPHQGDFVEGGTVQAAYGLNNPLKTVCGENKLPFHSFLSFDCSNIEVDAVKKTEDGDGLAVRIHEFTGARQKVSITPGFPYRSWQESDLRERPVTEEKTGKVELALRPYDIRTVIFRFDFR